MPIEAPQPWIAQEQLNQGGSHLDGYKFEVRLILLSGLMSRLRDSLSFNEDSSPESFGISVEYSSEHAGDTLRNLMGINLVNRFAAARQCEPTTDALLRL